MEEEKILRKVSEISRQTCLCQISCSLALKLEALGKYVRTIDILADVDA